MERQPTCHFVQVIIGCDTAKAGLDMGSFCSPCFYFAEHFVNFLIKFCFLKILLESVKYIRYNVLVYTLRKCAAKPTAYMRGMDL